MPLTQQWCILGLWLVVGNLMLEEESTGQHDPMATRSDRNGNEAITGTASEAFARWLHHQYALF